MRARKEINRKKSLSLLKSIKFVGMLFLKTGQMHALHNFLVFFPTGTRNIGLNRIPADRTRFFFRVFFQFPTHDHPLLQCPSFKKKKNFIQFSYQLPSFYCTPFFQKKHGKAKHAPVPDTVREAKLKEYFIKWINRNDNSVDGLA
ncbi:MAG: hypothetical protein WCP87_03915 [Atribacterota bacterium]